MPTNKKCLANDNLLFVDCFSPNWVGDGYCDDETNNEDCEYDGGDCCGNCVNAKFCIECVCSDETPTNTWIQRDATSNPLVGDGYCEDEMNNENCNYDGGDCCGACINRNYCEDCECLGLQSENGTVQNPLVGNGFCNDETNILECNFDAFDCCGYNGSVNTADCTNCTCHSMYIVADLSIRKLNVGSEI